MKFTPIRMAGKRRRRERRKRSVGEATEEMQLLCIAGGNVKWYSCCGTQYSSSPAPDKHKITTWFSNSTFRYYIQKKWKQRLEQIICTPMFIAALFTIAKKWKQPNCSSTDARINKLWFIHSMAYYLAIKRNELLTHVIIWMNLKIIMLKGARQKCYILYDSIEL